MHQKYCLTWNTYSDHLRGMLHNMMKSNYQTDVTLVCDDKIHYKAHKIVLSACSPVMKDIIDNCAQEKTPIIYLKGIQHQEIESLLEFIYLGEATLYLDRIKEFLDAANYLEFQEISKIIQKHASVEPVVQDLNSLVTEDVKMKEDTVEMEIKKTSGKVEKEEKMEPTLLDLCNLVTADINQGETSVETDLRKEISKIIEEQEYIGTKSVDPTGCDISKGEDIFDTGIHDKNEPKILKKYKCDQCKFQSSRKTNLALHVDAIHRGIKYSCFYCNRKFSDQSNRKAHIKSVHEGVRYQCCQCGKQCKDHSSLCNHVKAVHKGVKYQCDQCQHQANTPSNLKNHILTIHRVKYSFDQCNRLYRNKD